MPSRPKPLPATVVLLVRHGLTPTTGKEMPAPGAGPNLSEEGWKQAGQAAEHISAWRATLPALAALYASPLSRTRETASVLSNALGLPVNEEQRLMDTDAGEWAGVALKELAKKPEWVTVVSYPSGFRFPGGESIQEMYTRVVGTVRSLAARHPGQTVIVVSHADPIKAVLADAMGVHLDLFQRVNVSPASVSAISYSEPAPSVMLVNWTVPESKPDKEPSPGPGTRRSS
jgi:probable phosphomutase (TIGR03848 family)